MKSSNVETHSTVSSVAPRPSPVAWAISSAGTAPTIVASSSGSSATGDGRDGAARARGGGGPGRPGGETCGRPAAGVGAAIGGGPFPGLPLGRGGELTAANAPEAVAEGTAGTAAGAAAPSASGNEKALIEGCAGVGPRMDSRSAGRLVTPPAFSIDRSIP